MIDLRLRVLPNAIEVDGKTFSINTDYRYWIDFQEKIQNGAKISEIFNLVFTAQAKKELSRYAPLSDDMINNLMVKLNEFFINKNDTPNSHDTSNNKIIDYVLDGEYIYGSFMAQYGIDLLEVEELHWHKFKALFSALESHTKIKEIMSYRSYEKPRKKEHDVHMELKKMWSFPYELSEEEQKAVDEFESLLRKGE